MLQGGPPRAGLLLFQRRAVNDDEWEDLRRALIRRARTRYGADAAEDIVQETIADFLVKPRIVAEGKLLNYLRRAVKNQAVERWRRTRHEVSAEGWRLMASLPDPVDRIGAADELARVEEMMGTAGMEVLATYAEEGARAAARRLGISEGNARVLVSRARLALRGGGGPEARYRLRRLRALAEAAA